MTRQARICLAIIIVAWISSKTIGSLRGVTHEWGPQVGGHLSNGTFVYFQSRKVGGETDDKLVVVEPNGVEHVYMVDQIHVGFGHVVIRYDRDGDRIWVESDGKVGASLELLTGEFWPEASPQPVWAQYGKGQVIAEGNTFTVLQKIWELLAP